MIFGDFLLPTLITMPTENLQVLLIYRWSSVFAKPTIKTSCQSATSTEDRPLETFQTIRNGGAFMDANPAPTKNHRLHVWKITEKWSVLTFSKTQPPKWEESQPSSLPHVERWDMQRCHSIRRQKHMGQNTRGKNEKFQTIYIIQYNTI